MSDDRVGSWVGWAFVIIVLALACAWLSGCTLTRGDSSFALMQLAPGDEVQSSTSTVVGIEAMPMGMDGPVFRVGYVRAQRSRVPGFDSPTQIPFVRITTSVDGHGVIVENLEVNDDAPPNKSWLSR